MLGLDRTMPTVGPPLTGTNRVFRAGIQLATLSHREVHRDHNISVPTKMWGERTQEWVSGSSTAQSSLSHVVDFLLWVFAPAKITEVYAIAQEGAWVHAVPRLRVPDLSQWG